MKLNHWVLAHPARRRILGLHSPSSLPESGGVQDPAACHLCSSGKWPQPCSSGGPGWPGYRWVHRWNVETKEPPPGMPRMFFPEVPEGLLPFFAKDGLPPVGLRTTQSLLTIPSLPPPTPPAQRIKPSVEGGQAQSGELLELESWTEQIWILPTTHGLPVEASLVQFYTTEWLNWTELSSDTWRQQHPYWFVIITFCRKRTSVR